MNPALGRRNVFGVVIGELRYSGGKPTASAPDASVVGGRLGKAKYFASMVLGELDEETEAAYEITP